MTIPENLIKKLRNLETSSHDIKYLERLCNSVVDSFLDESKNGLFQFFEFYTFYFG